MKGPKRFAVLDSSPDTNDTAFRNKRIMAGSSFDIHRAEPSQRQSTTVPPLDVHRAESSQQHVRALNTQFASWVQAQLKNHPDELWEDGIRDYLAHASNIMEKFSDVVNWLKANAVKGGHSAESLSAEKKLMPEIKNSESKLFQGKTGLVPPSSNTSSNVSCSSGVLSNNQSIGGSFSNIQSSGMFSNNQSTGLFSNSQSSGFNQSTGSFSKSELSGLFSNSQTTGVPFANQSSGLFSNNQSTGLFSKSQSSGLFSDNQSSGAPSANQSSGLFSNNQSTGLFSKSQSSGLFSDNQTSGAPSANQSSGLLSNNQSTGLLSKNQSSGLFSNNQTSGPPSANQSSGLFSNTQSSGVSFTNQSSGLFSNSQTLGVSSANQSFGLFSSNQSTAVFSKTPTPLMFGQNSSSANHNTSDDENEAQQPSSPSIKKSEEKGIVIVHEVKCKLYVKSSDPADKDTWKDKGTGQLSIKCKEDVSKGTKESKPTIIVRNDAGRVLLNALLYPGIKTNSQKNSLVAIFHTAGDDGGNNDNVVARTFLFRTKTEEDRNKLAMAIQEYAPASRE